MKNEKIENIVNRAMKNEQEAIEELYNRTYSQGYSVALQMLKNEEDALDVLQEAYISAFRNLKNLSDPSKFKNWINCIIANKCKNYLRKHKDVVFSEIQEEGTIVFEETLENEIQEFIPEDALDYRETKKIINEILQQLPDEQRLVILMFYYNELSIKEIADSLQCSENTVKSRLKYAKEKIKNGVKKLEEEGTILYNVAPIPFIIWMLQQGEKESEIFGMAAKTFKHIHSGIRNSIIRMWVLKIGIGVTATVLVGGTIIGLNLPENEKNESAEKEKVEQEEKNEEDVEEELNNEENTNEIEQPTLPENESAEKEETKENEKTEITSNITKEQIEKRRIINQAYRDFLTQGGSDGIFSGTIYQFGVIDINGDEVPELFVYSYDPTEEQDTGPDYVFTYDEEVCGAGMGWGVMKNTEYCVETKHFLNTHYYEDGAYDIKVYEFDGSSFGDEIIYLDDEELLFLCYIDSSGNLFWGSKGYVEELTEKQQLHVKEKLNEYFPTKTKVVAPYQVNEENLNKCFPIDDEGIIKQLGNE